MTVTVQAHEVEGVRYQVVYELESDDVFPSDCGQWRTAHDRIGWLLDLDDILGAADGSSVEIPDSPFLAGFAKECGEYGCTLLASALTGQAESELADQWGKGMISFAHRLGAYEGVVV